MELLESTLALFVGQLIKAHFPVIESVLVDLAVAQPQALMAGVPLCREVPAEAAVSALGMVDLPPTVSIGSIHIAVGSIDDARAALASALAEFRAFCRHEGVHQ